MNPWRVVLWAVWGMVFVGQAEAFDTYPKVKALQMEMPQDVRSHISRRAECDPTYQHTPNVLHTLDQTRSAYP